MPGVTGTLTRDDRNPGCPSGSESIRFGAKGRGLSASAALPSLKNLLFSMVSEGFYQAQSTPKEWEVIDVKRDIKYMQECVFEIEFERSGGFM